MRTRVVLLFAAFLSLPCQAADAGSGGYRPEWLSLTRHEHPQWLLDAKFGIHAHWGVYAVPAYKSEWYGKMMCDPNDIRLIRQDSEVLREVELYRSSLEVFNHRNTAWTWSLRGSNRCGEGRYSSAPHRRSRSAIL